MGRKVVGRNEDSRVFGWIEMLLMGRLRCDAEGWKGNRTGQDADADASKRYNAGGTMESRKELLVQNNRR